MKIAQYAAENGSTKAIRVFSEDLGWPVPESNERNFKKAYFQRSMKVLEEMILSWKDSGFFYATCICNVGHGECKCYNAVLGILY